MGQDRYGNLYAVKGKSETYPCVVSHLDQVQRIRSKDFKAIETRDIIFGYSPSNHQIEGPGCDDKNGIFIALEALKKYECLKAVFFREEEIGCRGSSHAEMEFFKDCRFVIQCDRRGNSDLITTTDVPKRVYATIAEMRYTWMWRILKILSSSTPLENTIILKIAVRVTNVGPGF